jgi:DNA-binding sugar fermentation-stimulating protein
MLHTLPALQKAVVVKRPSASIKSPYVADIRLEDGTTALCHTPGLSCSGLVVPGRTIYVSKSSPKSKTAYTAQVSENTDSEGTYYIGIHPMVSQQMASKLLEKVHADVVWKSEVCVADHTRLDFVGSLSSGKKVYVEVKNAMISTTLVSPNLRAARKAIFPEGYRKTKDATISPRAVKHAETLASLMKESTTEAAYLVFIVPRNDCLSGLELNLTDPTYCNAVLAAKNAGVQIKVFSLDFQLDGSIHFVQELQFHLPVLAPSV